MRNLVLAIPIALAACATVPASDPVTVPGPPGTIPDPSGPIPDRGGEACDSSGLQDAIGQPATAELGSRLLARSGATIFRWLPKGSIITMEYNANRLNVLLDGQNRVETVRCG